jgi:NADH-quinone oxidoreductase subunit C
MTDEKPNNEIEKPAEGATPEPTPATDAAPEAETPAAAEKPAATVAPAEPPAAKPEAPAAKAEPPAAKPAAPATPAEAPAAAPKPKPATPPAEKEEAEEEPPPPPHPLLVAAMRQFPDDVSDDGKDTVGDPILRVTADRLIEVVEWLRDDEGNRFNYLSCVTAIDWTERVPRFDVVYHLRSLEKNHCLTVKVGCEDGGGVPSVVDVWKTADWLERETYDLYGVEFLGHPNLERIFLPEDWEGHPLRKDYPLEGPNLELLTRQQAAFRGGRFDRIRGDYEMTEQEREMAGPGVVGPLWTPKPEAPPEAAEGDEPSEE